MHYKKCFDSEYKVDATYGYENCDSLGWMGMDALVAIPKW